MKSTTEKTTEALNDLVKINHDRIEGYEKAIKLTSSEDADLKTLFNSMIEQSRECEKELTDCINAFGEKAVKGTRMDGKIYRTWMGIKSTFTGKDKDRHSLLASCERGEDAAQKAYEEALKEELTPEANRIITAQKNKLRNSHDKIRDLRDMQHVER
jgi:uncharacterized protein (TIGR02284 family)